MTDTIVSSATKEVVIGFGRPFVMIGEKINPTGRKILAEEMRSGDFSRVEKDALDQVAAGAPGWVWNSGMEYVSLGEKDFNVESGEELFGLLQARGVEAVYIDPYVSNAASHIWAMIEPGIGGQYQQIYSGREGSIRVLLLNP